MSTIPLVTDAVLGTRPTAYRLALIAPVARDEEVPRRVRVELKPLGRVQLEKVLSKIRETAPESLATLPAVAEVVAHRSPQLVGDPNATAPLPDVEIAALTTAALRTEADDLLFLAAWDFDAPVQLSAEDVSLIRASARSLLEATLALHIDSFATAAGLLHNRRLTGLFHEMFSASEWPDIEDRVTGELRPSTLDEFITPESRPNRDAYRMTRFPRGANRHRGTACAVQPRSSIVIGHDGDFELVCLLLAGQMLVALEAIRALRRKAYSALGTFRSPAKDRRLSLSELQAITTNLESLELDLSFEVEAYLPTRLTAPTQPLQDVASTFVELFSLRDGARVVGTMLTRITRALEAERIRSEAYEDERRAKRRAIWQPVAAVAVPASIAFGYLGANVRGPDRQADLLQGRNLGAIAVVTGVLIAIAAIGWSARAIATRFVARREVSRSVS